MFKVILDLRVSLSQPGLYEILSQKPNQTQTRINSAKKPQPFLPYRLVPTCTGDRPFCPQDVLSPWA